MNHRYIQRGVGANQPGTGVESARGRTSQRANKPKGKSAWHRERKSQGRISQGQTSQRTNKPGGEQARGEPAKGRKSHNSFLPTPGGFVFRGKVYFAECGIFGRCIYSEFLLRNVPQITP